MAGRISKETIDEIFRRADIVEVVSDYVALKKRGANYWGLSPFKQERTPSFSVSPSKGIYKCFSTGKGGNVVGFLMEIEGLTYPQALRLLAKRYGIPIAENDNDRATGDKRESMFVLNHFAAQWFARQLNDEARKYFASRGFDDATIKEFGLGYCPESWTAFTDAAVKAQFSPMLLLETGLSTKSEKTGNLYDRFRGRVIFPIHDVMGRVAGFAGRVLSSEPQTAKYVNSPESEVYHKGKLLYGLHLSKTHIRAKGECYLVEGYTDVVSLYQAGVKNVCAGAGTALTPDQAALIKRFADTVTVLYDGDAAGVNAALRGVDVLLAHGLNVYVLQLPPEHDPDSFVRQHGAQAFFDYAARQRTDFIAFKIRALGKGVLHDPAQKTRVVRDVAASVARIPDDLRRTLYFKSCADALAIEESLFAATVREEGLRIQREQRLARERERRLDSNAPSRTSSPPPEFPPEPDYANAPGA
ncbi:MAG: DNA primase, partial [Bacteroidia bacterium]|nr:DNA primase [Bacteroidia bacterium]